jgi:hypothetical protein
MENNRYVVQVSRGLVTFRVLRDTDADSGVSTELAELRPTSRGEYRVEVMADGSTEMTVKSGKAEVYTPRGVERLNAGRTLIIRGTGNNPILSQTSRRGDDDWDRWNDSRDSALQRSESYRYVSRDVYGVEDLDGNGSWVNVAPYGYVWSPRVSVGWAPYRSGRWAWTDWYGWTWVSYDSWGWAPYHYGRWMYEARYGWCWWPGGIGDRHRWSPALVSFVGWGGGGSFGVGIGFGRVGWIPLAPYETYRPWYGRDYYRNGRNTYNIVNNVNITNVYRNSRVNNGITVVNGDDFSRGRVNHRGLNNGDLQRASTFQGQLPITPNRESLRVSDRAIGGRGPESNGRGGGFFSRTPVRAVDRVPFEEQRRGIEENTRRTFPQGNVSDGNARTAENGRPMGRSNEPAANQGTNPGWRRLGDAPATENPSGGRGFRPQQNDTSAQPAREFGVREPAAGNNDGGWRTFGTPGSRTEAPAGSTPPVVRRQEPQVDTGADSSWRRFGTPGDTSNGNQPATPRGERTAPVTPDRNPRTRGFEQPTESAQPRGQRTAPMVPDRSPRTRSEQPAETPQPRVERAPRTEQPAQPRGERSAPIAPDRTPRTRASEPPVESQFRGERSAPIQRSEPRFTPQPRQERMERSAPQPQRVERQAPVQRSNGNEGRSERPSRGR